MRSKILIITLLLSFSAFAQSDEIFKMKKAETNNFRIDKKYTSDTRIDLSSQKYITALSISGEIKLKDSKSLIRIVLITKAHEYLVYEAYTLINNSFDFLISNVCEETSLVNN